MCTMAEKSATTYAHPDFCNSPIDYSIPSYSYVEEESLSPIKNRARSWSEDAEDLRVDRVRRRSTGSVGTASQPSLRLSLHRCGECPYATKRRTNLERHRQAMHSRDKQLECCGSLFSSKSELRRHVRHQHESGYGCLQCGRLFCRKALLKRHMSVHNGVKEFACRICSYASSHKSNLERHERVHDKQKPEHTRSRTKEAAILKAQQVVRDYVRDREVDKIMTHLNSLYHKMADGGTAEKQLKHTSPSTSFTPLGPKRMFANPYKCLLCNLRYQSQESLKKHERELHPDLEVQAFLSLPMKQVLHLMRLAGVRVAVASQ
ncbi:zinc finger protein 3-like [Patiria miniata]|uniref:C2H2-type domain-containing protein n=1 Tax=Patiria miniata TaxID=46514 RepID=A0A913ZHI3_PATMI|nr:zinc finger protein 3-like [Patiria miniata]